MFMTLYKWELKKIWKRRITKITLAICVAITIFMGVANIISSYSINGESISAYEYEKRCHMYSESISGRTIDDSLLHDMRTSIEQDGTNAYNDLYQQLYWIFGDKQLAYDSDANNMYQQLSKSIDETCNIQYLSADEKAYWLQKKETFFPYTWQYAKGYQSVIVSTATINIMLLFLLAVCLPAVFSDEHIRRTDQLVLSSRFGKKQLYRAKLSAGISFGIFSVVLFYAVLIVLSVFVYGTDGFHAGMHMLNPICLWAMNMGQAAILSIVLVIIFSVLYSILAMFLAEILKNGIASTAILVGITLCTLFFNIPYSMKLLSKLYSLQPFSINMRSMISDYRLFHIFGQYFSSWQLMPFLYILIAMILGWLGGKVYQRYQVTGR